jgi:hypothetical protein
VVEAGKRNTVPAKQKVAKCMVVGDSLLRSVGAKQADMKVECFPGISTEQLHRVINRRDIGSQKLIIHVGTNGLRRARDIYFLMGEVYALVATAKELPNYRIVLSGVL